MGGRLLHTAVYITLFSYPLCIFLLFIRNRLDCTNRRSAANIPSHSSSNISPSTTGLSRQPTPLLFVFYHLLSILPAKKSLAAMLYLSVSQQQTSMTEPALHTRSSFTPKGAPDGNKVLAAPVLHRFRDIFLKTFLKGKDGKWNDDNWY